MTFLVLTPDRGKQGDTILRPAKFFCCVNACTHGYLPRFWHGERYQPVVLPPRGDVLEDKALYLAEVEQRETFGIARSLRPLSVTGGTQWRVTLGLADEVAASNATKGEWSAWHAFRTEILARYQLPSLNFVPADYAERGLVLSAAGEEAVRRWQEAANFAIEKINVDLLALGPKPPSYIPLTLYVTWENGKADVREGKVQPNLTATVQQLPVPAPTLLHCNPNVLLRLYGVAAEQQITLDAAVSGYQSDLKIGWITVSRDDVIALFGSLPDGDMPDTVELRPAHVGGIYGPYVCWEDAEGREFRYAHRGGTGYHYSEVFTGPASGWEDVAGLDWAGDEGGW